MKHLSRAVGFDNFTAFTLLLSIMPGTAAHADNRNKKVTVMHADEAHVLIVVQVFLRLTCLLSLWTLSSGLLCFQLLCVLHCTADRIASKTFCSLLIVTKNQDTFC